MHAHTWVIEHIDAGSIDGHFWTCTTCGAAGGPAREGDLGPEWRPFYADGSGLKVSDDCDEAKAQIAKHVATWVPPDRRPVRPTTSATVGPVQLELTVENLAQFEASAHTMAEIGYQLWGMTPNHLDAQRMESFYAYCDAERERTAEARHHDEAEMLGALCEVLSAIGR